MSSLLPRPLTWPVVFLLGCVGLFSIALRIHALAGGIWLDEATSYFESIQSSPYAVVHAVTVSELNPPGYFLALHSWLLFAGTSTIALKMPSLIASVLLIPLLYWLTTRISSRPAALLAATIAAVAPISIYYAQEARPYAIASCLACVSIGLFLRALATPRASNGALLAVALAALVYVQYTGILLCAGMAFAILCISVGDKLRRRAILVLPWTFAPMLALLPWVPYLARDVVTGAPWVASRSLLARVLLVPANIANMLPFPILERHFHTLWGVLAIIWVVWAGIRATQRTDRNGTPIVALAVITLVSSVLTSLFSFDKPGYMMVFCPALWVVLADSVTMYFLGLAAQTPSTPIRLVQGLALAATVTIALLDFHETLGYGRIAKSGNRALVSQNQLLLRSPQTLIIAAPDYVAPSFEYYAIQHSLGHLPLYGFARWNNPEIFQPHDYRVIWSAPTAVAVTLTNISKLTSTNRYHSLALLYDARVHDIGSMMYHRANTLHEVLKQRYRLKSAHVYPGSLESVTLYLFDVEQTPGQGGVGTQHRTPRATGMSLVRDRSPKPPAERTR